MRAVLFDAAGTLLEPAEPVGESYARLAARRGVRLPAWRLEDAFRRVLRAAPPMAFPGRPGSASVPCERAWWRERVRATFRAADATAHFDDFDAFFEDLWRHFSEPEAWRARPGASAVLRALRGRGLHTGVVSNFDQRLPGLLAGLGLAPDLDVVVLPADVGAAKPEPAPFLHALRRLGVAPHEAAYVGDDAVRDLAGARGAGLRAIDPSGLATLEDLPELLEETSA